MATNSLTRRALIDQIPTEEGRAAPAVQPAQGIHSTELGRQVYNTAMALPGMGGVAKAAKTGGLISRALNTGISATNLGSRTVAAMAAVPTTVGLSTAAAAQAPKAIDDATPSEAGAGAGRGYINPTSGSISESAQTVAAQPGKIQYDAATKTYSGNNIGAGAQIVGGRGGGSVTGQNMQAADQLSANQNLESIARVASSPDVPSTPQNSLMGRVTATHSGNDWTAREALRRAKMDATSLIHQSRWANKGSVQAAQKAYGEALQADIQAMTQGQTAADVEVMRQNAGIQREVMQQVGADRRDGRRSLLDAARLGMDQETQGFTNRAAAQQEQLRNTLLDPNATPEQRALAQRSLAALSGKTAADRLQTVSLPDTISDTGQVIRGGQALVRSLDDGSVQQVPVSASVNNRQVPQAAIEDLRRNPQAAAQFDEIFGQGASKQYLQQR